LHAAHCFDGWTPPPLTEIAADEKLVAAAATIAKCKEARAMIGRSDKEFEAEQKEAQAVLEAADLPIGEMRIGPWKVRRTHTQRKATFAWEKAETAGLFEPGLYGDFFKPGASFSTFKVEPDAAYSDIDAEEYGDVPF
jgi:hypothetical protein